MKAPYHLILIALFITTYSFGQIDSFPPEAEMKLITLIEHEKFTFRLDKFEKEGVPNLSMSKGKEFIRVGADLPTILKEVWPKQIFEIHPGLLKDNYHLMIQHLDQEATDEFFAMILEEWIKEDGLDMQKKHKNLKVNCVRIKDLSKLSGLQYKPEEGVVKSASRTRDQVTLKGYTLQEMLGILSHESGEIYMVDQDVDREAYNFQIDLSSRDNIVKSLKEMGLQVGDCVKKLEVVTIE